MFSFVFFTPPHTICLNNTENARVNHGFNSKPPPPVYRYRFENKNTRSETKNVFFLLTVSDNFVYYGFYFVEQFMSV